MSLHPSSHKVPLGLSSGPAAGGWERQPQVLPRHGQRPPRTTRQGEQLRYGPLSSLFSSPTVSRYPLPPPLSSGCAGCFSAPIALELYAEAFASIDALQHLPAFTSIHGAAFYRLPPNQGSLTLVKRPSTVPDTYAFGSDVVVPLKAGTQLQWTVEMQ